MFNPSDLRFACRVFFRMWPSATFFFNHTPCLGFVLISVGLFCLLICLQGVFRMWPSATFFFNHTPCFGFVMFSGGLF